MIQTITKNNRQRNEENCLSLHDYFSAAVGDLLHFIFQVMINFHGWVILTNKPLTKTP